jgi:hypothetical protein
MAEICSSLLLQMKSSRFASPYTDGASDGGNLMIVSLHQPTDRTVTRPTPSESPGRILPFRPRAALGRKAPTPAVPDLEKYERTPEEPDDFRHRMIMNGLGLGVTVVLIAGGLWIAEVMAHMRKDQDCALSGRSNCMPVELPPPQR